MRTQPKFSLSWRPRTLATTTLLGLALCFASCQKDDSDLEPTKTDSSANATLQQLLKMGFKREHIEDKGDFYLVEGDIRFDKQTLSAPPTTRPGTVVGQQDQASVNSLIDFSRQPSIAIRVAPSANDWRGTIEQAVRDWNGIEGSRINLYISDGAAADITIEATDYIIEDREAYGIASWPVSGNPGNTIRVIRDSENKLLPSFRRLVVVHELGHCLGFHHTNLVNGEGAGPEGWNVIPGTPREDPNSVMNTGNAPNQTDWRGFSQYDIIGLQNLYPENLATEQVFDADYYRRTNDDLRDFDPNAAYQHWATRGLDEDRGASFVFDKQLYRSIHSDLAGHSNRDLVIHWLNYGLNEGRASSIFFDVNCYLDNNPDLQQLYGSQGYQKAIEHYLTRGIDEGRVASPRFNVKAYLRNYPDLASYSYREAMLHYVNQGQREGRNPL
jgi:hypothetical protein